MKKLLVLTTILASSLFAQSNIESNMESFLQSNFKTDKFKCENSQCKLMNYEYKSESNEKEKLKIKSIKITLKYDENDIFTFSDSEIKLKATKDCKTSPTVTTDAMLKACIDTTSKKLKSTKSSEAFKLMNKIAIKGLETFSDNPNNKIKVEKINFSYDNKFFKGKNIHNLTPKDLIGFDANLYVSNLEFKEADVAFKRTFLEFLPKDTKKQFSREQNKWIDNPIPLLANLNNLVQTKYKFILDKYKEKNTLKQTLNIDISSKLENEKDVLIQVKSYAYNENLLRNNVESNIVLKDVMNLIKISKQMDAQVETNFLQVLQTYASFIVLKDFTINIQQQDMVQLDKELKNNEEYKRVSDELQGTLLLKAEEIKKSIGSSGIFTLFNYQVATNQFKENKFIVTNPANNPISVVLIGLMSQVPLDKSLKVTTEYK